MRRNVNDGNFARYWSRWDDIAMWGTLFSGAIFLAVGLVLPFVQERIRMPRSTGMLSWLGAFAHLRYAVWLEAVILVLVGYAAIRAFLLLRRKRDLSIDTLKP